MLITDCSHNEKILLRQVSEGDPEAFRILYNLYQKKVYHFGMRFLKSDAAAEDVLQEVFTLIWVNRKKIAIVENFSKYINTITLNYIYSLLRRKAYADSFMRKELLEQGPIKDDGIDAIDFNELQLMLGQAIRRLAPQQRKVFELSRLQGFKHEQIAEQMNISKETVKKHCMEAVRNIKNWLQARGIKALYMLFFFTG